MPANPPSDSVREEYYAIRTETVSELRKVVESLKTIPEHGKNSELLAEIRKLEAELKRLKKTKRYGLVWEDKPEEFEAEAKNALPVLEEVNELAFSDGSDKPQNLIIEGDNFHSLAALSYTHKGLVDVIYIDPPYNTGNKDFVYNDRFVDKEDDFRHSKWLSFMEKRLRLARDLLKETGVIFISIDDNEQAQLKMLCDEVFGEGNFRNTITTRRFDKNLSNQFLSKWLKSLSVWFEYVLCYAKSDRTIMMPVWKMTSKERQESWYWKGFWNSANRPTMRYELLWYKPETGQWKNQESVARESVENYKEYVENYASSMSLEEYWLMTGRTKKFIRRNDKAQAWKNKGIEQWIPPSEKSLRTSNWTDVLTSNSINDFGLAFSNPKDPYLIKQLLNFWNSNPNSLILDFFAGSGTTGHAVLQLNKEDGGNRRFILCSNRENTAENPDKNLCRDVCYQRVKRVAQGYENAKGEAVEGLGGSVRYFKTAFVAHSKSTDDLRHAFVDRCSDILRIKEDCFDAVPGFSGDAFRAYSGNGKNLALVYDPSDLSDLKNYLEKTSGPVTVYVFAIAPEPFAEELAAWSDRLVLEPVPDGILSSYRKIYGI